MQCSFNWLYIWKITLFHFSSIIVFCTYISAVFHWITLCLCRNIIFNHSIILKTHVCIQVSQLCLCQLTVCFFLPINIRLKGFLISTITINIRSVTVPQVWNIRSEMVPLSCKFGTKSVCIEIKPTLPKRQKMFFSYKNFGWQHRPAFIAPILAYD